VYRLLLDVWEGVKTALCNDAPEGYVPEDVEEVDEVATTKDILSYSWRALKEARYVIRSLLRSRLTHSVPFNVFLLPDLLSERKL